MGNFYNKDKPILKDDNLRRDPSSLCDNNCYSFFSKVIESAQHLQCSYTNHSAWNTTKVYLDFPSFWWLSCAVSLQLFCFPFLSCFGFKHQGSHQFLICLNFYIDSSIRYIIYYPLKLQDLFYLEEQMIKMNQKCNQKLTNLFLFSTFLFRSKCCWIKFSGTYYSLFILGAKLFHTDEIWNVV